MAMVSKQRKLAGSTEAAEFSEVSGFADFAEAAEFAGSAEFTGLSGFARAAEPVTSAVPAGAATSAETEGLSLAQRMRRLVATGKTPLEATLSGADQNWGPAAKVETWLELDAQKRGLTPSLIKLLEDPRVTDVVINSTDTWADWGEGLQRVNLGFTSETEVRTLAGRLAAVSGRRLDDASPILDGTLAEGVRVHAVISPVAAEGTLISLRAHRPQPLTLAQMVEAGTMPEVVADLFRSLVSQGASVLISGSTGSGKTTLLASLLGEVSQAERIVCIEEAMEVRPTHPHVVHLQERQQNVEGQGSVSLSDLVRAAMRMRPDRLVLGECRGAEVREVLTALNTGHRGGMATIHANSVEDVPARLIALGVLAKLEEYAISALAVSALDVVVQMKREQGLRYVSAIGVLHSSGRRMECAEIAKLQVVDGRAELAPEAAESENWREFLASWGVA